jgi:hypothetical protein
MKWNALQDYIEQREREIDINDRIDLILEINNIENMYRKIKANVDAIMLDGYSGAIKSKDRKGSANALPHI